MQTSIYERNAWTASSCSLHDQIEMVHVNNNEYIISLFVQKSTEISALFTFSSSFYSFLFAKSTILKKKLVLLQKIYEKWRALAKLCK